MQCTVCATKVHLESDFFEKKPCSTEKLTCFSRISQVAGIASKTMSWIFAEMEMLFCCLGVAFFFLPTTLNFCELAKAVKS